ncbi:MAG: glycerate kinase, partial [Peptidiphaga sp.]
LGQASAAMAAASADADAQTGGDLLGAEDLVRGPYAGAGGGAAFGLRIVGARVLPVREAVAVALEGWASQADLCLYVSGAVGESPPGGLDAAVACAARRAVPLVLVCDSASLQRSELARLGLNGVYEIRPGRAFDDAPETPATAAGMAGALTDAVARVAGTWGWE